MTLTEVLETLRREMRTAAPQAAEELRDGLTADELDAVIAEFEEKLGDAKVQVPDELRELFSWADGTNDEAFIGNLSLLSAREALATWLEMTEMIGHDFEEENRWHEGWFPFATNGGGDYVCVDAAGVHGEPGQIVMVWHADDDRIIETPTLLAWFEGVLEAYEEWNENHDDGEDDDWDFDDDDDDSDDEDDDDTAWEPDEDDEIPEEPNRPDARRFNVGPGEAKPVFGS